ncbi:MAG: ABC transporter ATP-binding protein [Candidatus Omnitrophota bacterium]
MIKARDIHKYYKNGKEDIHVLKGIDLQIAKGEIAAILGPSGAGKSTLLHILGGLDQPSKGQVSFEGNSLWELPQNELSGIRNRLIGFVFQFYHLLPEFTVLENVLLPALIDKNRNTKEKKEKAEALLSSFGLENRAGHFPSQLSGGEQQRTAIARALINEPKLLLCDEPTGNLDSENGQEVCRLLKKLNQEKAMTIVMVTHNLDMAKFASKVYNIKDGYLR